MLLTIAVVTYNCEHLIAHTLKSIQTFKDNWPGTLEIIVIDGESSDNTLRYIQESSLFDVLISESDNGIFDAMNKACEYAKGKWICYMNAGDSFIVGCESKICDALSKERDNFSLLYGDTYAIFSDNQEIYKKAGSILSKKNVMPFCHQSAFTKTEFVKRFKFDTNYPRVADQKLYLNFYRESENYLHITVPVSKVVAEGFSSNDMKKTLREELKLRLESNIIPSSSAYFMYIKGLFIQKTKALIPPWLMKVKRSFF